MTRRTRDIESIPWWAGWFGIAAVTSIICVMVLGPLLLRTYIEHTRKQVIETDEPAQRTASVIQVSLTQELSAIVGFQARGESRYPLLYDEHKRISEQSLGKLRDVEPKLMPAPAAKSQGLIGAVQNWHEVVAREGFIRQQVPADDFRGRLPVLELHFSRVIHAEADFQDALQADMAERRDHIEGLENLGLTGMALLGLLGSVPVILITRLVRHLNRIVRGRDEMIRVVSHDLRSPLTTTSASASLLLRANLPHDKQVQLIEMIQRSAARMNRLIGDLLDQSRAAVGLALSVNVEEHDLARLLYEVRDAAELRTKPKAVRIDCDIAGDPGSLPIDRDRILQALSNLLDNAIRFTPEDGWIRIGCENRPDGVLVYVANSGPALSLEQVERSFLMYWQGEMSSGGGLGLGLPIARWIIQEHGGSIWAENRAEGPAFCFTLPRRLSKAA